MSLEPDRATLLEKLGGEVGSIRLSVSNTSATIEPDDWLTDDIVFRSSEGDEIPAWFLRPSNPAGPVPAILYCHAHGARYDIGRAELFDGRPALTSPYAPDLRALGCAVLCLELPCFGQRQEPAESPLAKAFLWRGRTLFGRMLAELAAGIDFLADHPAIDRQRIGAMGISMGGTHAWWLGALDERIQAVVSMCCFADLASLVDTGAHDGHGQYMTVPDILNVGSSGQIAGLTAPRAQLVCVGMQDWSTPEACFLKGRADLEQAYAERGAPDRLSFHVEQKVGHEETPAMRARVLEFLRQHLMG